MAGKYDQFLVGLTPATPEVPSTGKYDSFTSPQHQDELSEAIPSAVKRMFTRPAAYLKDLGTNPESMANAMPSLMGAAGGIAPIPGGMTGGTAIGQGLRDSALDALGKPVPSGWQHAGELAGSAAGDVVAIPAVKAKIFGKQIGRLEKAAGVPGAEDIESTPMNLGQKSIGEYVNDAIRSVKDSGGQGVPEYWLKLKDQVDRIYEAGKQTGLTTLDNRRLAWLNKSIQKGLNTSVPGRAGPSAALASSQKIPNILSSMGKAIKRMPPLMKTAGGAALGVAGWDALKHALSGSNRE